jgi:mannose-6-phosphate isomerase-like protein (cupin superfamily)
MKTTSALMKCHSHSGASSKIHDIADRVEFKPAIAILNPEKGSIFMRETKTYPYETHLNIYFPQGEVVDAKALADNCTSKWYNQTLCQVNDSVVRLGVVEGEYHWHQHEEDDEFFYVVEGKLLIDLPDDRTVELTPRQGFVVPRRVMHRTRATERTVILMVENAGIIPTGD